jgi:hypothetical protein
VPRFRRPLDACVDQAPGHANVKKNIDEAGKGEGRNPKNRFRKTFSLQEKPEEKLVCLRSRRQLTRKIGKSCIDRVLSLQAREHSQGVLHLVRREPCAPENLVLITAKKKAKRGKSRICD